MECKLEYGVDWDSSNHLIFCSFEGVPNKDSGSKTVEIFPIIDQNSSEDSITICCSKEARVRDVIGLACLKYCKKREASEAQAARV